MKKIAVRLLAISVLLVLLGIVFASMASHSNPNAFGIAMTAVILFWGPAALMVLVALVLFVLSKISSAVAEVELEHAPRKPTGQCRLKGRHAVNLLICKSCNMEMFPDLLECVWCGQQKSEVVLLTEDTKS